MCVRVEVTNDYGVKMRHFGTTYVFSVDKLHEIT